MAQLFGVSLKVRFCEPDDDDFLADGDEAFDHGAADSSSTAGDEGAVEGEGFDAMFALELALELESSLRVGIVGLVGLQREY